MADCGQNQDNNDQKWQKVGRRVPKSDKAVKSCQRQPKAARSQKQQIVAKIAKRRQNGQQRPKKMAKNGQLLPKAGGDTFRIFFNFCPFFRYFKNAHFCAFFRFFFSVLFLLFGALFFCNFHNFFSFF